MSAFDYEAEIRDLAARRDILQCVVDYARGLDRLDRDILSSAFAPDAQIDAGMFVGAKDAYVDFCMELLATMQGTHHQLGQVDISLTREGAASGETYFTAWHATADADGAETNMFAGGRYVDEFTRVDGQWKIAKRKVIFDWASNTPGNHPLLDNPDLERGKPNPDDFSAHRKWPSGI